MPSFSPRAPRRAALAIALLAAGAVLTACAPEPAVTQTEAPSASTPPTSGSPSAAPSASTEPAALPTECREAYSPTMTAELEDQGLPLNDPGLTLLSSGEAPLLELLEQVPTLRCTWGAPGEAGLSTNVSVVDAAQARGVLDDLAQAGFGCEESSGATVCRIEQRGVTLDDVEYVRGETHAVQGDVWLATAWVDLDPDGYTEDILATLRG